MTDTQADLTRAVQGRPASSSVAPAARVTLWTRVGCHLCEQARAVVGEVCGQTGDGWTESDVDGDPDRQREWTDKVPVVTVDGTVVDFWRVDPDRLRDRLTGRRSRWRGGRGAAS